MRGVHPGTGGAGGSVTTIHVDGAQLNSAATAIENALKADPSMDGVLTTGILGCDTAGGALQSLGKFGTIKLGTFDVSTQDLNAVRQRPGAVRRRPAAGLEGYMAVQVTAFEVRYSQHPFGTS